MKLRIEDVPAKSTIRILCGANLYEEGRCSPSCNSCPDGYLPGTWIVPFDSNFGSSGANLFVVGSIEKPKFSRGIKRNTIVEVIAVNNIEIKKLKKMILDLEKLI